MKIAYLLDTFPSTSETFIAREIEALRRRGIEIEVFAFNAGEGATPISQSLAQKLSPRRWEKIGESLQLRGFDHVHAGWANHLADVARAAAKRANIPWSFSAHARDLWVEGGDLKSKLASAKFAASCTLAGVEELKKFGDNVVYAPHGLELKRYSFHSWQPLRDEAKLIGVGRLVEKKGWSDLFEIVWDQFAHYWDLPFVLELVGDGPDRAALEKAAAQSVVQNWVRFRGALPHEDVVRAMQNADCLVLPSRRTSDGDRDGLANVLLEAAALGLPIITTNAGSASDFVDETTGFLVEAGDSMALQKAIWRVFDQPEHTIERCLNARKRVEERFDVDRNVEVLARLFINKEPRA